MVYDTAAKAATAKLVANLTVAVAMQGFVEALRLGESGGLTTDEVIAALDKTTLSAVKDAEGRERPHRDLRRHPVLGGRSSPRIRG